jgi:hypothetical protein
LGDLGQKGKEKGFGLTRVFRPTVWWQWQFYSVRLSHMEGVKWKTTSMGVGGPKTSWAELGHLGRLAREGLLGHTRLIRPRGQDGYLGWTAEVDQKHRK